MIRVPVRVLPSPKEVFMLERFYQAQQPSIARLTALEEAGLLPLPSTTTRPAFAARLTREGPGAIIAEYKRASPSKGIINLSATPEEIAEMYAKAGASALSVLTEEQYFKGSMDFLPRMSGPGLPLLRKDFLVHPLQVVETAAGPASALLLIARMLDNALLEEMLVAAYRSGLEAVVEIFDENDLGKARRALDETGVSPVIIQVNNRDLQTLEVSEFASQTLIKAKRSGEVWISASGVNSHSQVLERSQLGYDAVLVGGFLMESIDPGAELSRLTGKKLSDLVPDQRSEQQVEA